MSQAPFRPDDSPPQAPVPPMAQSGSGLPPLMDVLRPILRPPPGRASAAVRRSLRVVFWLALALVLLVGAVLPYLAPHWMPFVVSSAPAAEMKENAYPPGTRLRDCRDEGCPWLVVVPAGEFMMGSANGEEGHQSYESPQHRVRISEPFAVMEAEVTRGAFARFVKETGYKTGGDCITWGGTTVVTGERNWSVPGFTQTPDHPVVCMSWNDGRAFATWLSERTGQSYRLLSEAEWEYAARAGSTTRYYFGDDAKDVCQYAKVSGCKEGDFGTAPVKSFKPNAFGLYDMHGNAWEWVQDCWHDNYQGAPEDGSKPWEAKCSEDRRVLRGGGWSNHPVDARSAIRVRYTPGIRNFDFGFRLARTLTSSSFTPLPPEQRSSK